MSADKEQFNTWIKQWEDAQAKGIIKVKEAPVAKEDNKNFFGLQNEKPRKEEKSPEAEYWNTLAIAAAPPGEQEELLSEQKKDDKTLVANAAKAMAQSPNPIRANSVGKDQDLNPQSLGLTYSEQDIEELAEMKTKLHSLQDQLNSFEGRGQNGKKFESQIESLKQKIDELSDAMTRGFPYALSPQGD